MFMRLTMLVMVVVVGLRGLGRRRLGVVFDCIYRTQRHCLPGAWRHSLSTLDVAARVWPARGICVAGEIT
jgi:hypothetical protein